MEIIRICINIEKLDSFRNWFGLSSLYAKLALGDMEIFDFMYMLPGELVLICDAGIN